MSANPFRQRLFEPHVGSTFKVTGQGGMSSSLILDRLKEIPSAVGQEQYALYFLAQADVSAVQGTYVLQHESLGELNVFLVPVRRVGECVEFEACFNHLVTTQEAGQDHG
jgi:hypothetical protein